MKHSIQQGESFLKALSSRLLLLDGSTGVEFQRLKLTEEEVRGRRFLTHPRMLAANFDILNLSRPELVAKVHTRYLRAGADIIETNTFNSTVLSQTEYGTGELDFELNLSGARIARREADRFTAMNPAKPRFVAGSMGPTALSASLPVDVSDPAKRAVDFDTLAENYARQALGLIEGGADFLLIETAFDILNVKAALDGAARSMDKLDTDIPVVISLTISDASGRILSGHTPEAILAVLAPFRLTAIGFNCSAGPETLSRFTREFAAISPFPVIFYPNAGLPDRMGNYSIAPAGFAESLRPLIGDRIISIIGGCCGTGPDHIAAVASLIEECGDSPRKLPEEVRLPWLAGMEPFYDDRGFINVGERCNVAGSRKFLRLVKEHNLDEAIGIARRQVEDGAMILDINMDDGMLDSKVEMASFLRALGSDPVTASVPWMIDSSDFSVIEEALKNICGRAVVNSISLKHGEGEFMRQASIIRRYGAAVVVMLFDENGQADSYGRKIEIAERAIRLLSEKCGFDRRDIIIDPNVLTIATGMPEHDGYAKAFIDAVDWIRLHFPGVKTSGGVSNLSFAFRGNNPLRQSMHAVFLYHAAKAGLSMAIVDPGTKVTYSDIPAHLLDKIEDAVLCRVSDPGSALAEVAGEASAIAENGGSSPGIRKETLPVDRRLTEALIHGDNSTLSADIPEAIALCGDPNKVVEDILMNGMEEVGRRFETGKMFLPQVVKSARTMHRAVELLQPYLEETRKNGKSKGKFLVATVKGDIHDIGKNIAAVVLRCNNYEVIDLGVQVDSRTIIDAIREHKPDFIGLSGLISPSLEEMAKTLAAMRSEGISIPVFVGGAATSDIHTALRLAPVYGEGIVTRSADASQGPVIAGRLQRDFSSESGLIRNRQAKLTDEYNSRSAVSDRKIAVPLRIDWEKQILPVPSFKGVRTLPEIPVSEVIPFINWTYFYNCWKVRPDSDEARSLRGDAALLLQGMESAGAAMRAQVAFYTAASKGDDIIIDNGKIVLPAPRQKPSDTRPICLSLADYIAPDGYSDYIGCFCVTTGDVLRRTENADEYESLLFQSLCDRLAEATSEWLHYLVRTKLWGYSPDEPLDFRKIRQARYRGIRPAVGYPSLPDQKLMHTLMKLLAPSEIGVGITENGALSPSSTVAGFYFASPEARYFSV